jgi:N-acetylglutamate synthase-like GNAT family acetyltransferase
MAANIRRLQSSDRDDVVEISRHIWEGHDYLPSVFDQWLQDPYSNFYGVEADGRVVAVGNLRLVENGKIGWMEGLRVHPDCRGRGFANMITCYFVGRAEDMGVQRLRYTTAAENAASVKLARRAGFSRILRMAVSWHFKPEPISLTGDDLLIRKMSPRKVCGLLKASSRLIPHGILTYDWKALDNTCPNLEEIGKTHTFYVASRDRKADSVSFGCPMGEWWSFTVYAADSGCFLSQLAYNVAGALKRGLSSVVCTHETRFERTLNTVDLGSDEHRQTHLVLLEKRIRTLHAR